MQLLSFGQFGWAISGVITDQAIALCLQLKLASSEEDSTYDQTYNVAFAPRCVAIILIAHAEYPATPPSQGSRCDDFRCQSTRSKLRSHCRPPTFDASIPPPKLRSTSTSDFCQCAHQHPNRSHGCRVMMTTASPSHATAVSAPGKVLLAGGYLVLDRDYNGLVFGLDARMHVHIQQLPTSPGVSLSEIIVRSPQFRDAEWRYGYRVTENHKGVDVTQLSGYVPPLAECCMYLLTLLRLVSASPMLQSPGTSSSRRLCVTP